MLVTWLPLGEAIALAIVWRMLQMASELVCLGGLLGRRRVVGEEIPSAAVEVDPVLRQQVHPHERWLAEVHGRAALLYGEALESFDDEVRRIEASIESIRQGRFLEALVL